MKIAIGPIEGHYGGAAQHILNIKSHSENEYDLIEIPKSLESWGNFFRTYILPLQKRLPHEIEHSDKRFDMYGLQSHFDMLGFVKSRFSLSKYDIIHLHGHPWWEQIYNVKNPNTVYTIHNLYNEDDFPKNWIKTINMLTNNMIKVCKKSKSVISVAKWLQDSLKKKHGIESIYIPNGVNLEEFDQRNGEDFRKKFGIQDDFYLFVGRATKYKRPELFADLAKEMPYRKFVMIGRGLTKGEFKEYYKKELPQNMVFIGEPERRDVVNAFDACRAFILPSSNETFGIVILESMAAKKPAVAANNLGPKEIISPGRTGFLFQSDNLESLAMEADKAWNANEVGLAGRQEVEKNYDWKKIVPQIEEVYRK